MYEPFFGLSGNPFQLSPDPFFMFGSEKCREALTSISYAISRRKGFVVMTGEVGTGKTLVLRCLFELWEREQIPFAYFIGPRLSTVDFLSYITFELGIKLHEPTKGEMLRALYGFLLAQFEKGLTTVLIIDEAHQMPRSVLEEIRVLANFETAQQKLIQIVLVGQPELEKKLDSVELRSLKQRVAVRCQLEPLRADEIRHYIQRRLDLAGADPQAPAIFPAETVKAIYRYSQGIPRLVNSICDQALIAAYARQIRVVPVEIIHDVAANFRLDRSPAFKQTEKPFSPPVQFESPAPAKAWHAAAAGSTASVVSTSATVPETTSRDLDNAGSVGNAGNVANVAPGQTAPAPVPALSSEPRPPLSDNTIDDSARYIRRPTPTTIHSPEARAPATTPEFARRDSWAAQLRRWLQPGLRLSLIITIAAVVPAALAMGVYMSRRQKPVATPPHQVASVRETFPEEQRSASIQPAGVRSGAQAGVGSLDRIAARTDSAIPKFSGEVAPTPSPPNPNIMAGALSRPVLKSPKLSTSAEPPLIAGMQTQAKELDLAKDLLTTSAAGPTAPSGPAPPVAANDAGELQPARLISSPPPIYPLVARAGNVRGVVVINAVVNEAGKVTDMKVISGSPLLTQAAMDALRTWKYEPAKMNGRPTASHVQVSINFTLR
jgi:general secretion pathway protein A